MTNVDDPSDVKQFRFAGVEKLAGDSYVQMVPEVVEKENILGRVSHLELGVALALVLFGALPLAAVWFYLLHQIYSQQQFALLILLALMAFCLIETYAIIIMAGMGRLTLPKGFLHWLGAATIGEVAGLVTIAVKYAFSK